MRIWKRNKLRRMRKTRRGIKRKQSLFIVRTIRNTQMHCVGRVQSFSVLNQLVRILTTRL
jgi:hypothetical protein